MEIINEIKEWLQQYPVVYENLKFLGVILLATAAYLVTKKIILKYISKFVSKTKTQWDDLLLNEKLLRRISYIPPFIILYQFLYLVPEAESFGGRALGAIIVFLVLLIISSLLDAVNSVYNSIKKYSDRPIKGYLQIIKIVVFILGIIVIAGILTGQQPWALLTGVGALTAVIILVFRDTILSFVASIQISSYDLVKKGDWIEVSKYGADGDVIDIALHTIKVQNWDKTITVIPTYKLIEESFKNWRGMRETGGRRIKRSIFIDISSVKFLTEEDINKLHKIRLISDYIDKKKEELKKHNEALNIDNSVLVNGRRLTNLGTFRAYLKAYLKQREDVNPNLTFLVRHLEPGATGLPIEIYVFARTTQWAPYEDIQADIFDHIFSVVPEFGLRIFQYPSGHIFDKFKNDRNSPNHKD